MLCKHFGLCGGCTYLDIPYEKELTLKEAMVRDLLAPFDIPVWEDIIPAPNPMHYRNKMEFAFGDEYKDGPLALGIRKKRNFYEVAIPSECTLIPDDFKTILDYVLRICRERGEAFFHRKRHVGTLRHLVLRCGEFTGEVLINLVTSSASSMDMKMLAEGINFLKLKGQVTGLLHTLHDGVSDTVKNENVRIINGRDYFYEKICGLTFKVSAFSFFQTNSAGAEVLYSKVKEYAGEGKTAYDLYCGTGTIAQVLAGNFEKVTGVELNAEAIQAADENAKLNDIQGCEFIAGDVLKIADNLTETPDCIIVDPPRDGLHPKALPKIVNMQAKKLVYVSCKPSSLARDLALLAERGYKAEKVACVDMFPRTPHVESVCLMSRMR